MATNKATVISNFFWRFFERCGYQAVSILVSIILARILSPSVYGTIALVTVFTTIMQVFVDSGMGSALIQKKDADDLDFSTVFYFNLVISSLLYLLMFFLAPLIADFYKIDELTPVIRVLSLNLIIAGLRNIQQSYISRNLIFKRFFFATLTATILSAIIGIYMAYNGYGVWALVAQNISNTLIGTIILWFTVQWKPKLIFSFNRLKNLFSFGWKLLASSLLDIILRELRSLIIGKYYTKEDLAFYNRGELFPKTIVGNINTSIDSVLFPTMSNVQDNQDSLKAITRRSISISTYIIAPCMVLLAACAEPIIKIVLTDKWLDSAFYLRVFCFSYCFYPIHTANLNSIKALGRSDIFLKLEILKKTVVLIGLLSTVFISVKAIAYSTIVIDILCQIINTWPNKKLLNYSYLDQIKDIIPSLLLSCLMGIIVYYFNFIDINIYILIFIQIITGFSIYFIGSFTLKLEPYNYIVNSVKSFINKKKSE